MTCTRVIYIRAVHLAACSSIHPPKRVNIQLPSSCPAAATAPTFLLWWLVTRLPFLLWFLLSTSALRWDWVAGGCFTCGRGKSGLPTLQVGNHAHTSESVLVVHTVKEPSCLGCTRQGELGYVRGKGNSGGL